LSGCRELPRDPLRKKLSGCRELPRDPLRFRGVCNLYPSRGLGQIAKTRAIFCLFRRCVKNCRAAGNCPAIRRASAGFAIYTQAKGLDKLQKPGLFFVCSAAA